jgi:hypothetical protein
MVGSAAVEGGSPAVPGSGGDACLTVDQRGVSRPQGARCDVGAFEDTAPVTITSTSSTSTTSTSTSSTTTSTLPPDCPPTPRAACIPAPPRGGALRIGTNRFVSGDTLVWSWKGTASPTDFGTPTSTTAYHLCVYEAAGLDVTVTAPAGALWSSAASGFRYSNRAFSEGDPKLVLLVAGVAPGRSRLKVNAPIAFVGGSNYPYVPPPPLRVQLARGDGGACWENTFSTARIPNGKRLSARAD